MSNSEPSAIVLQGILRMGGLYTVGSRFAVIHPFGSARFDGEIIFELRPSFTPPR